MEVLKKTGRETKVIGFCLPHQLLDIRKASGQYGNAIRINDFVHAQTVKSKKGI